jgi:hypothetical protein
MVIGHAAQLMPGTDSVTVFDAPHAELQSVARRQTPAAVNSFFIGISF